MKLTVLVDNKTENAKCQAEWGLSLLIETRGKKILFDTGASDMFIHNGQALGIDLSTIDVTVLSHGHYDHTGGVPSFIEVNDHAKVYLHENGLKDYYGAEGGDIDEEPAGISWSQEFVDFAKATGRLVFTRGRQQLADKVDLIGNIPRLEGTEATENFYYKTEGGFELDDMSHEQILVVEEDDKLFVFSGCSHIGVLSILEYVKKLYPGKKIAGFIAGMHLYAYGEKELEEILVELEKRELSYLVPLHCTGMMPIMRMKERFGEGCIIAMAGDTYEF